MAKTKLLITDGLGSDGLKMLEQSGLFDITFHKSLEKEELKKVIGDFDAIVIRSATKLTKDLLDLAKNLKVVMRAGAGVDNVDVPHASSKKILVFNCPGVNSQAVAELVLGFMFGLLREIPRATAGMKMGLWEKKELVGFEAAGRTIGILGFGNIGSIIGRACVGLGMKVVAYDPQKRNDPNVNAWANSVDEVFEKADIVSVNIPLLPQTKNSIGAVQFKKMKKGSYLINASRGGIVNEADLLAALNDGTLAGAALDVFDQEPTAKDHPLVQHPKVICAPHIGASTKESQTKIGIAAAKGLIGFYKEGEKTNTVNGKDV